MACTRDVVAVGRELEVQEGSSDSERGFWRRGQGHCCGYRGINDGSSQVGVDRANLPETACQKV